MAKTLLFETTFDTYTSTNLLGEGGSGKVYEVTNGAGEIFALKCLGAGHVSTEKLKRFKNEIGFCLRSTHPNIVRVIDTGAFLKDGVKCPFYVMKRYSSTLRKILKTLTHDESLRLFSQLLDGVEAAHLVGVRHRDLKPENVLWDEREKILVLADFGIAHFEEDEIYTAVETNAAARLANFQYSAPEQRARGAEVGPRADIFALGLILNELFTGEIAQGAGYKRIGDVAPSFAYLDDLVNLMIQQNPASRPATIETIKKELIGRKNEFVALQRLDEAKRQVVRASAPPAFEPISIVGFDFEQGTLSLTLSRNVPPGWAPEFRQPRGGYQSILGHGPETFMIAGNRVNVGNVRQEARLIQQLIDYAKSYCDSANRGYVTQIQENAARAEREQRAAQERMVAEAELRKQILSAVKL